MQCVKVGTRPDGQCPIKARRTASFSVPRPDAPPSSPAPPAPRYAAAGLDRNARPRGRHRCHRRGTAPIAAIRSSDQIRHCPTNRVLAFTAASIRTHRAGRWTAYHHYTETLKLRAPSLAQGFDAQLAPYPARVVAGHRAARLLSGHVVLQGL